MICRLRRASLCAEQICEVEELRTGCRCVISEVTFGYNIHLDVLYDSLERLYAGYGLGSTQESQQRTRSHKTPTSLPRSFPSSFALSITLPLVTWSLLHSRGPSSHVSRSCCLLPPSASPEHQSVPRGHTNQTWPSSLVPLRHYLTHGSQPPSCLQVLSLLVLFASQVVVQQGRILPTHYGTCNAAAKGP